MSDPVRKFDFGTVFSADGEVLRDGETVRRVLTREEVEQATAAAFEEGQSSVVAQAAQQQAEAVRAIASQMQLILARLQEESDALRRDAATTALVAAKKIAGAAIERHAAGSVTEFAQSVMADLRSAPVFRVRCADAIAGEVSTALEQTASEAGFEGAIDVRADAEMNGADCRLEWGSGEIERSREDIEDRIDALVAEWLAAPHEDPSAETAADDLADDDVAAG
jgi:flagellar assembly protein FliH